MDWRISFTAPAMELLKSISDRRVQRLIVNRAQRLGDDHNFKAILYETN